MTSKLKKSRFLKERAERIATNILLSRHYKEWKVIYEKQLENLTPKAESKSEGEQNAQI